MKIETEEAVRCVFHGKANMIVAARAAGIELDELKHLLKKMIERTPECINYQLVIPFKKENEQEKSGQM